MSSPVSLKMAYLAQNATLAVNHSVDLHDLSKLIRCLEKVKRISEKAAHENIMGCLLNRAVPTSLSNQICNKCLVKMKEFNSWGEDSCPISRNTLSYSIYSLR